MEKPCLIPKPQVYLQRAGYFVKKAAVSKERMPSGLEAPLAVIWPEVTGTEDTIQFTEKKELQKEQYVLEITEEGIEISWGSPAGAFYAVMTLHQLVLFSEGKIACCRIVDFPGLRDRAVMIDISRGKVPKVESLKAMIDLLAGLKIKQLSALCGGLFFCLSILFGGVGKEGKGLPDTGRDQGTGCLLRRAVYRTGSQSELPGAYECLAGDRGLRTSGGKSGWASDKGNHASPCNNGPHKPGISEADRTDAG